MHIVSLSWTQLFLDYMEGELILGELCNNTVFLDVDDEYILLIITESRIQIGTGILNISESLQVAIVTILIYQW